MSRLIPGSPRPQPPSTLSYTTTETKPITKPITKPVQAGPVSPAGSQRQSLKNRLLACIGGGTKPPKTQNFTGSFSPAAAAAGRLSTAPLASQVATQRMHDRVSTGLTFVKVKLQNCRLPTDEAAVFKARFDALAASPDSNQKAQAMNKLSSQISLATGDHKKGQIERILAGGKLSPGKVADYTRRLAKADGIQNVLKRDMELMRLGFDVDRETRKSTP